jgi:enoyl-CoA hydratase/carnithine racemase
MARHLGEVMAQSRNNDAVGGLVVAGKGGCFSAGIDRSVLGQELQASPFDVEVF